MVKDLSTIDPEWAWSPYRPDRRRPWDQKMAAHLYRRAGFGASPQQLKQAVQSGPEEAVQRLLANTESGAYRRGAESLAQAMVNTGQLRNLAAAWLYRMLSTPDPLLEKMTLFWHGHFATGGDKVQDVKMMRNQNELLRRHALGDFGQLVREISHDPAMLIYLDSTTNRKSHPNENYARELMELFCLGEGNYSERDVQELARCFTGWEVKRDRFRFNPYQHDSSRKTLFGRTGDFSGDDGVNLVLTRPSAPQFIVGKLVRFFVLDEPAPSSALLEPLAQKFRENGLCLRPVVQRILSSQLFYSEYAIGRKLRSPIELAVGLLRSLEGTTSTLQLAEALAELGQGLYEPPNVKGWEGGRTWINSSTLLGRVNLVRTLLVSDKSRFGGGDLESFIDKYGIDAPTDLVDWLAERLLAVPLSDDVRERLVETAASSRDESGQGIRSVIYVMSALPEFQLG